MGKIMGGVCPQCGYRAELFTGGGLRDCDPETALAVAPGDAALATAMKGGIPFRIERFPAFCGKCRKLIAAARVTYWRGWGEQVAEMVCPDCGGPLGWSKSDSGRVPCPNCGGAIPLAQVGHWD